MPGRSKDVTWNEGARPEPNCVLDAIGPADDVTVGSRGIVDRSPQAETTIATRSRSIFRVALEGRLTNLIIVASNSVWFCVQQADEVVNSDAQIFPPFITLPANVARLFK